MSGVTARLLVEKQTRELGYRQLCIVWLQPVPLLVFLEDSLSHLERSLGPQTQGLDFVCFEEFFVRWPVEHIDAVVSDLVVLTLLIELCRDVKAVFLVRLAAVLVSRNGA